ncbi:MAG: DUF4402 domain-containing protein [Erythrobacter sp.]|jgi:hypothetical protein|nr:DUF4402 domain-containing protein [Erythrobacter sp.]
MTTQDGRSRAAAALAAWHLDTVLAALVALAALAGFATAAAAQDGEVADARAFIITPLSFVKETDLDFGEFVPAATAGTVFMDSAGNVSTTGGVIHVDGTQRPALFWGYGQFNQTVLINVTANSFLLRRDGGSETMRYDQVTIGSQPPIVINQSPRRFRIINPDGYFNFTIAGRLRVGANQRPGVYTGEFGVNLEYE